jgi:hypothetical protein
LPIRPVPIQPTVKLVAAESAIVPHLAANHAEDLASYELQSIANKS